MDELFKHEGEWYKNTVKEMKSLLSPPQKVNTTAEDSNALQCLHHLRDARLVDVTWDFQSHSETIEIMRLIINGKNINLVLEESRDVYHNSKATLKHRLAGEAMEKLTSNIEKDWRSMTLSEMRDSILKLV
jgi:hypothetical protein